jgi:phosphoribosylglycinamide formyltransferase-1
VTTRLVVLASGNGSNLQAIIDACETQALHAQVVGVVSDNRHAFALQRAAQHNLADAMVVMVSDVHVT